MAAHDPLTLGTAPRSQRGTQGRGEGKREESGVWVAWQSVWQSLETCERDKALDTLQCVESSCTYITLETEQRGGQWASL